MTTDSVMYVFGSGVIATLSGSVAYLFKLVLDNKKEIQNELDECQEDRKKLWNELDECQEDRKKLWEEIAKLKYTLLNRNPSIES